MSGQSALQALLASRKAKLSRQKTLKPQAGRNRYRLLPGWRGADDLTFFLDFGQHFVKDAAGEVKAVFVCTEKTFGQPCEVCNAIAEGIAQAGDDLTIKRLKDAASGSRVLLNVLVRDNPEIDPNTPQLLEVAPSVFNGGKKGAGIMDLISEGHDLLDLAKGVDIIVKKEGTGKEGTSYSVAIAAGESKPVSPDVLKKLHDLDKFASSENEETMQRALTSVAAVSGVPPRLAAPNRTALPNRSETPAAPASNVAAVSEASREAIDSTATRVVETPTPAAPAAAAPANDEAGATDDPELAALLESI
jgi:hypothetical protein